jgi:hypothetical protein
MIQLRILRDSYLKKKTVDSLDLEEADKVKIAAGNLYELDSWAEVSEHLFVELAASINGKAAWFVFSPDAEILKDGQPLILQSDTRTYEFMRRLDDLSDSISKVQNFLSEQMKYKQNS